MSVSLIALALLLTWPLTLTAHRVSTDPNPVSVPALTADGERSAELAALVAERYAPGPAHGTTDDNAVRRALRAAARHTEVTR